MNFHGGYFKEDGNEHIIVFLYAYSCIFLITILSTSEIFLGMYIRIYLLQEIIRYVFQTSYICIFFDYTGCFYLMTRFQQALKGAFLKILTCNLLQIVGKEKGMFSCIIYEDTFKIMKIRSIYERVVIRTKNVLVKKF